MMLVMYQKSLLLVLAVIATFTVGCGARRDSQTALSQKLAFEQKRVEIAAQNILNMNTTRDMDGKCNPYRRKMVQWHSDSLTWSVVDDPSPLLKRYEPGHPDADS